MLRTNDRRLEDQTVVVSGLARSGTSMLMRMLQLGGLETLTDGVRQPDRYNPRGYFELEAVKSLGEEGAGLWLEEARGRAVKVVSHLIRKLPGDRCYKVIFMNRRLEEVILSQNRMLAGRGRPFDPKQDPGVARLLELHLDETKSWLRNNRSFDLIEVDYRRVLERPFREAGRISGFIGADLDVEKMAAAVEPGLHRNRV